MIDIHSKLSGRYIITQPIGSGGMANVYLARDLILDRDVAVKVLRYDFQDNQDAIRRFQREAMAASQLLHHNIVEVYDVDEEEGQQYIVMEYVQGMDLKNYIRENAPLSLELAVNIMSQILQAIDVAHKHGIIHRDIKPQNVLITNDHEVKITDFGIAIALSDTTLTQTNTLLGSVHYLSPEQARGSNATIKSDIYALGSVLYELITGEVPFDGESAVSIALKHFQEDFPNIRDRFDYVPQSLENVVLKATAKSPEDRYGSVQEMLNDLSTSLSIVRMHESRFDPTRNMADPDSLVIAPIKPIGQSNQSLSGVQQDYNEDSEEDDDDLVIYDEIQPYRQSHWRKWIQRIALFIVALLICYGAYVLISNTLSSTIVPDIYNVRYDEAVKMLEEADLQLGEIEYQWDEDVADGNVVSFNPRANLSVKKDSQVDLIISSGPEQVEVRDYTGQNYEEVRQSLLRAGFIVGRHDLYTNNPEETGIIMAQSIDPGSRVIPGQSSITLTVGSYSESSVMQDFYNLSIDTVYSFADNYGLNVEYEYQYHDFIPEDRVFRQSPTSGTNLQPGDTISVTISMGTQETEIVPVSVPIYIDYVPRYAENDYNQTKPLPNVIEVYIGDANNNINTVAEQFEISESTQIQLTLYVPTSGIGQYRIIQDGKVIFESPEVYPE